MVRQDNIIDEAVSAAGAAAIWLSVACGACRRLWLEYETSRANLVAIDEKQAPCLAVVLKRLKLGDAVGTGQVKRVHQRL